MVKLTTERSSQEETLTVREAAQRLRCHENTIRSWCRNGRIASFKPGGDKLGFRIPTEEIEKLMAEPPAKSNRKPRAA